MQDSLSLFFGKDSENRAQWQKKTEIFLGHCRGASYLRETKIKKNSARRKDVPLRQADLKTIEYLY
jgi:hypothetical protein